MPKKLPAAQRNTYQALAKYIRYLSIKALKQAQSGHPGGSLSSADILALLYGAFISKKGNPVVVSNGHISPAVYATLSICGYVSDRTFTSTFRKAGSIFEGHVTRHVPGVWFGTGPLGIGVSAAVGFAEAERRKGKKGKDVYALMGDGEFQEGMVHEMMHSAVKQGLDNLCIVVDHNQVQLSGSTKEIMPINMRLAFKSAGWNVYTADGHDMNDLWEALSHFQEHRNGAPTIIIANTVMGKGVSFMEKDGKAKKATWHGKAPSHDDADLALRELSPTSKEMVQIAQFQKKVKWKPTKPAYPKLLKKLPIKTGKPKIHEAGTVTDSRSSFGEALLDLAKLNKSVVALTADLRGSVKTAKVAETRPDQHIDVGIAEQHMLSMSGGLSLNGIVPFATTFGAFMTSRAKDQVRVNDINHTNVKMVATHCGLSVGEDGPTHQAIDDMGSMLGILDTMVMEPADANQCDHMTRYMASRFGNFYMRMGRHKYPVLTKENGKPYYGASYKYEYGKVDAIRQGRDLAIVGTGAPLAEAMKTREALEKKGVSTAVIAVSSIKHFHKDLLHHLKKKKGIVIVEDHNSKNGLASTLRYYLMENGLGHIPVRSLGVNAYQLSGTAMELYAKAGIDAAAILKAAKELL